MTIKIKDKEYPCDSTMGALLRFKRLTGKDVSQVNGDVGDSIAFLYCCCQSACNRDNLPFDLSLDDFADGISLDDFKSYNNQIVDTSKKKPTTIKSPQR